MGADGGKGALEPVARETEPELWIGWVGGGVSSRRRDVAEASDSSTLPALVVHADWGADARKQWMCVAERTTGRRYHVTRPEPVGDASALLRRLSARASGRSIVVGFDFPIGVPTAYAQRAGIDHFAHLLARLGTGDWDRFYDVAETADDIDLCRPFYPRRSGKKGEVKQHHLLDALGIASMNDLLRTCERATNGRGTACPLFWTLGAKQVGKAALLGWREVLAPAVSDPEVDVALWPFDGELDDLIARKSVVIVETYPAEACTHLGLTPPGAGWSKRRQDGRRAQRQKLRDWAAHRPVELASDLAAAIDEGFGPSSDAEDPFDALLGLLSMLDVILGYRAAGAPRSNEVRCVEGWILGQEDRPGGCPQPHLWRASAEGDLTHEG
jgi:hypothetical protein